MTRRTGRATRCSGWRRARNSAPCSTSDYSDALRAVSDEAGLYTFWDYQAGAWQKNLGLRIDHCLLSPQAADRLGAVVIDKAQRAKDKPSDHVPIRIDLVA